MREWYFAYGSNLWIDQIVARTGPILEAAERPKIARLPQHRLVFNLRGDGEEVFANLERPGDGVLGVLYSCSREALAKLDEFERGYQRRQVFVVAENGERLQAMTYVAEPANLAYGRKPSPEYVQRIVRGARQHGLPEAYIREIETRSSTEAKKDSLECEALEPEKIVQPGGPPDYTRCGRK